MTTRANIVVIGGGLAGMSAALEALHQTRNAVGVSVALLEKEARTGGNSAKASSGINGVLTRTQKAQGVADSVKAFARDTERSGHGRSNETLVHKLTEDSTAAVTWLQKEFGLDLDVLAQLGGHSAPRTHRRPEVGGKPQP
ncbi:Osmotic growth protein, partial [Coemansia sp. RSA 1935]